MITEQPAGSHGTGFVPWAFLSAGAQRRRHKIDAAGNETNGIAADGSTHGYEYDAEGRLISVSENGATTATYAYNALGQQV
ncbi:MAG: hypothetical protein ACRD2G_05595, partial [Terriglobia bacterium]